MNYTLLSEYIYVLICEMYLYMVAHTRRFCALIRYSGLCVL